MNNANKPMLRPNGKSILFFLVWDCDYVKFIGRKIADRNFEPLQELP